MQLAKTEVLRGIFTFLLCSMANNGGSSKVQTLVKLQGKKINFAVRVVTDRTFGSAELLLCGSAQMTELFSAEHRTFFSCKKLEKELILKCLFLPESLQEIKFVKTYYHINLKIFVCLLYLGFTPN